MCAFASSQPNSDTDDCIIATACNSDTDCAENNPCSVDSCETTDHVCLHVPAAATTVCRSSAADCDATDHCDGMSTVCADGVAAAGTVCRSSAGACDPANPKKGGSFELIQEKKWDGTPEDELRHDVTDELAAYKLAQLPFPGVFGVFYETDRPTKNALEKKWIETTREKSGNASDLEILQKTFDRMK